ncbi:actin-like protein 10 [Vipera latastei]
MEKVALVVDNGSSFCRSGFAGEEKPRIVMKTASLPPIYHPVCSLSCEKLQTQPLKHGIILDWQAMENLWSHLFYCGLQVSTEDHPILTSDSPSCPTTNREKMAEVFFEGFSVPALYVANTGFLSLCYCGRITGLAIEAGGGISHVTPIYAGQTCMEGIYRLDVAGNGLCKYMHNLLLNSSNNVYLLNTLNKKMVTQLKKNYCYVSMDYKRDLQEKTCHEPVSIETPDGHLLTIDKERFCCPEPLFKPHLLNQSSPGLHHLVFQSLQKVPDKFKGDVINNVVLSGGSSLFPGFPERMCLELNALFHGKEYFIKILASPKRSTAVWLGGSLAASLSSFQSLWMRKQDYQEHGAAYVHKKFK